MRLVRQEGHETALFSMADSRGKPSPYDKYAVPPIDFKRPAGPLQQLRSAAPCHLQPWSTAANPQPA